MKFKTKKTAIITLPSPPQLTPQSGLFNTNVNWHINFQKKMQLKSQMEKSRSLRTFSNLPIRQKLSRCAGSQAIFEPYELDQEQQNTPVVDIQNNDLEEMPLHVPTKIKRSKTKMKIKPMTVQER